MAIPPRACLYFYPCLLLSLVLFPASQEGALEHLPNQLWTNSQSGVWEKRAGPPQWLLLVESHTFLSKALDVFPRRLSKKAW